MPKISIITPIYIDSADKITWLDEMLQSVLSQTFTDYEVILTDDASPMLFDEIKFKYQNESRFRWLKASHNQGPSLIRNSAVSLAESDTLLPIDSDDILPSPNVIQNLYDTYLSYGKEKIIYGNLQLLTRVGNGWQLGKTHIFPNYSFENVMNMGGTIPVTSMYSIDCHNAAGGWKSTLQNGLEDVEYYIAAGKAGYCGFKIDTTTLIYRKHETSRSRQLRDSGLDMDMRNEIMSIHQDVYEGKFPMGCCGKGSVATETKVITGGPITTLDSVPEDEKIWVEYVGNRRGAFSYIGNARLKVDYRILGTGHRFQAHRDDIKFFRSLERGQGYRVGIPEPTTQVEVEQVEVKPEYNGGQPELAQLERLDQVAVQTRGLQQPAPSKPILIETSLPDFNGQEERSNNPPTYDLSPLNLPENLQDILQVENWTIQKLAEANPNDLIPYKGIGPAKSAQIVESAKQWLEAIT